MVPSFKGRLNHGGEGLTPSQWSKLTKIDQNWPKTMWRITSSEDFRLSQWQNGYKHDVVFRGGDMRCGPGGRTMGLHGPLWEERWPKSREDQSFEFWDIFFWDPELRNDQSKKTKKNQGVLFFDAARAITVTTGYNGHISPWKPPMYPAG